MYYEPLLIVSKILMAKREEFSKEMSRGLSGISHRVAVFGGESPSSECAAIR